MSDLIPRKPPDVVLSRDVTHDALRLPHRAGLYFRVRRGAYTRPSAATTLWARREHNVLAQCAALARQLSCQFVFSHETAALIHGCWIREVDDVVHVTQTTIPSTVGPRNLRRHFSPRLPDDDVTVVHGLRVTTLERTVEECARTMSPRDGLAIADSAIRILARPDRFDRAASTRGIARVRNRLRARLEAKPGARGIVRARAVVKYADGFSESPGETDLRWVAVSRGLPRPTSQFRIRTTEGTYYTDLGWVVAEGHNDGGRSLGRVIVAEYDGISKYGAGPDGTPLYAEKTREDAIRATGVVVHRFARRSFDDTDQLFATLCGGFPTEILQNLVPVPGLTILPSGTDARAG